MVPRRWLCCMAAGALLMALSGCYLPRLSTGYEGTASLSEEEGERASGLQPTSPPALTVSQTAPTATAVSSIAQQTSGAIGLADLQSVLEAVYAQAAPSVVNITSRVIQFDWFNQPVPEEGTGSGFVYDTDGHVVTNYHVIADATEISVAFADGQDYPATLVGQDASSDLAVLHVEMEGMPAPLPIADSDALRVGQFVLAIGNPFGLDRTMTFGIISALGRVIQTPDSSFLSEAIQTDAPINPGNSGGPLLDLSGRVIGVNSQIISTSQSSAGIGFAVSSNTVRRVVPELIATGTYPHPWLGVSMLSLTPERVRVLNAAGSGLTVQEGVLLLEVLPGSPADKAGLRGAQRLVVVQRTRVPVGGDVIVAIDGKPMVTEDDIMLLLDTQTEVGQELTVTYLRDGETHTTTVRLEARPQE